jgi:hypothetical protein
MSNKSYQRHYEEQSRINAQPEDVFAFVDDHSRFSSHMNQSSWMMGGSKMETKTDAGKGQQIGSHITMGGKVFGLTVFLDEVVTKREVPRFKSWETVGVPKLLVIGDYSMALEITATGNQSTLKVSIDYDLPKNNTWMGYLFGNTYAKWCVRQMLNGTRINFQS